MNRPFFSFRTTRREAFFATAGAIGASALTSLSRLRAAPGQNAAPSTGLLKKRGVKGRTIDVHAHILGGPKPAGAKTAAHDPSWTELPPVTPKQRAEALERFHRSGFDGLHFDSPEQEDLYVRKYTWRLYNVDNPGYFVDNAAILLQEMDDAGIDTANILLIDFAAPMRTTGPVDPSTEAIEQLMVTCSDTCKKYSGRFIPFIGIDLRRGPGAVKLLEKAVKQYGFRGNGEVVTTLWRTPPNDRAKAYPYYEACGALGIPVMIDCTMSEGFSKPDMYEDVAKAFPKLRIGLGGAGVHVATVEVDGVKLSASDRILQLANKYENLWLDLDDWEVVDQAGIEHYLDYLHRCLYGPARHRVMYGSDHPIYAWMSTQQEWIDFILRSAQKSKLHFTPDDWTLFFSTNALNYLGLKPG